MASRSAKVTMRFVIEIGAGHVEEFGGLFLDRPDDARVGMAGCDYGDAGGEVEEVVAVDIFDDGSFSALHNERITAGVGSRKHRLVAANDLLRLGPGQGSQNIGQSGSSHLRWHKQLPRISNK